MCVLSAFIHRAVRHALFTELPALPRALREAGGKKRKSTQRVKGSPGGAGLLLALSPISLTSECNTRLPLFWLA